MNVYNDMREKTTMPEKNYNLLSHNIDKELFLFAEGRSPLSLGHTALNGMITDKTRQNVVSREADKIKSNNFCLKSG